MPQVLSNADAIFRHDLKAPVPRSVFNLSHVHSFDADFGELIPFYYQYTVPNDTFSLSAIVKATALPMETPLYTALNIRTEFYFVPAYLCWHKFDRFLEGGRDGTFEVTPPIIGDPATGIKFERGSIADYFGLPVDVQIPPEDCPDAIPFMAYLRIWRDKKFNQDIQTTNNTNVLFPADEFDFQLADGYQTSITGTPYDDNDDTTGTLDLLETRYVNYRSDYFTSAMPKPQRGPMVAMPLSGRGDVTDQLGYQLMYGRGSVENDAYTGYPNNVNIGATKDLPITDGYYVSLNPDGQNTPHYVGAAADFPSRTRRLFGVDFASAGTFTVDDLRLATQLQLWLERNMRTKPQYSEFLRIHFDDAPVDLRLNEPYYIGGTSQQIIVSEILQQSESTEQSPLGSMAGAGKSFDQSYVGKFHSHEYGIIIGVMHIMPDTMYMTGLSREWNKRTRYDYYFPEFAQLSPQAVLSKELYCSADTRENNQVFGYQGRFDEMRHRRNYVSGALRNPNELDFYTWTVAREFSSAPTLTTSFISSKGNVRHDAFTTGDLHKPFIVQTGVEVRAVRPLPVVNRPMGLL